MKILLRIIAIFALTFFLGETLYFLRKGFSPRRVQHLPTQQNAFLDEETKKILDQPFYFLGKGRQSFAFASKDGKHVLKLPRTYIFKTPFWVRAFPFLSSYRKRLENGKEKRLQFLFDSIKIAQEDLQEETGVIAIHLGESEPTNQTITLVDSLNITHRLPLDSTIFILQHKQPLWTSFFLAAKQKNNKQEKQKIVTAFVDILIEKAKKGIANKDESFLRNYGFDGEKIYHIDIGDFYKLNKRYPDPVFQKTIRDSLSPVRSWLSKTDPEMVSFLDERINNL
jgi:hypothetical protein